MFWPAVGALFGFRGLAREACALAAARRSRFEGAPLAEDDVRGRGAFDLVVSGSIGGVALSLFFSKRAIARRSDACGPDVGRGTRSDGFTAPFLLLCDGESFLGATASAASNSSPWTTSG